MWMKIKKLREGVITPDRANPGDAGMDVYADSTKIIRAHDDNMFALGWACAIPEGWVLIMKEKSGRAVKNKLDVGACIIDSGYRGEVHCHLFNNSRKTDVLIEKGEKIAQLILVPIWTGQPEIVEELDDTVRGSGGFGSSGLKAKQQLAKEYNAPVLTAGQGISGMKISQDKVEINHIAGEKLNINSDDE